MPARPENHLSIAEWGDNFKMSRRAVLSQVSAAELRKYCGGELKNYFALCALARNKSASRALSEQAATRLFAVRVSLEKAMMSAIDSCDCSFQLKVRGVLSTCFFGRSKKQGVSLRLPLTTCTPSRICGSACYAHDVLDAAPNSMIRGALNGWLASAFQNGSEHEKTRIASELRQHVRKAVAAAESELRDLPEGYERRPFIRFSHVGEIVYYPDFANMLAELTKGESEGRVDCVVYTRHRNVSLLKPDLWIVNFTLDPSSMDRRSWIPPHARIVFSAFGGITSDEAEVNFLEHHRHTHTEHVAGGGRICPATKPETKVRTCDACRCNRCFVPPFSALIASQERSVAHDGRSGP